MHLKGLHENSSGLYFITGSHGKPTWSLILQIFSNMVTKQSEWLQGVSLEDVATQNANLQPDFWMVT